MRLLGKLVHEQVEHIREGQTFERRAARGIILSGSQILLLYTKRYNDYSFPGGGVDEHEDLITGLTRELAEEVGARQLEIVSEFGYIDEYRPYHKAPYQLMHMLSYFYVCHGEIDLAAAQLEDYEKSNGMSAVWISIDEAIRHNKQVIAEREASMGFSIARETYVLELVAKELVTGLR
ncbi:NUDIX hydrolase [Paenibacillus sp. YYML68]|uniref:NUDIX hydrolase n=1 Tax=Paenibacillus sp. YYML68 TaxID=2909250 RepID=UPI00249319CD|nr:NUDIX domain-containing protein [Paenibacillus sp. YYML68]